MSFVSKIKSALSKTSSSISKFTSSFTKYSISKDDLNDLEEILLSIDFGINSASKIIKKLSSEKFDEEKSDLFRDKLEEIIFDMIKDGSKILDLKPGKLNVILFCGVNGNGKTTTIGKLANKLSKEGRKVYIAACDTFRSAAIEQLKVWADRSGAEFVSGTENSDPASVAYNAMMEAKKNNADVIFIDTAGRLHNHNNLMEELVKIINVIKKIDNSAPDHTILTLDATTGQNAFVQAQKFKEKANIDGIIFTKLDGTAKGGALVGIIDEYKIPIYYLATGERIDDISEFDAKEFAKALVGK